MRLTSKKSIVLCIELWTWLAKTGKQKEEWPKWEKYNDVYEHCWFCEYAFQRCRANKSKGSICVYCPYQKKIGKQCFYSYYSDWNQTRTSLTRKKYAKLFLGQIKSIK